MAVAFERASPDDADVRVLYADFIRETDAPLGIDPEREIAAGPPQDLAPPSGVLLLVRVDGEPAGLGGVRHLDTSDYLTDAIGLYRAAGYREVGDYNANPKASLWFERSLAEEPIRISPYDPRWPEQFERERLALEAAIGRWATGRIHHVGSTAVVGLEAKPIIDILVGVEDLAVSRACFEPLAELGYLYAPYRREEMHWFCKPHPARRTHHLHLVPAGSRRFAEELAFRDFLRANPDVARDYASLKRSLAARFHNDREAYTEAKGDFIGSVLESAQL